MKYWNDLWLNEGFATFMESFGTSIIRPDWNIMAKFYWDVISTALFHDGLQNSHSVSVPIKKLSDIDSVFDAISYSKAASLICMVMDLMGLENMKHGLHNYLQKYQYSNAESEDLWNMLQKVNIILFIIFYCIF